MRSILIAWTVALISSPAVAQTTRWLPSADSGRGLPDAAAEWAPFAADPQHVCNRVFRAIWLARLVPAEVGAALPQEHGTEPEFFAEGWYFAKRAGEARDERLFGGDGRQLPRERFDAAESAAMLELLKAVDGEIAAGLRAEPRLAVWFQNDLLRLVRRLLDTKANPELLAPLLAAAQRVALPAKVLADEAALSTFASADIASIDAKFATPSWVELERKSTRLFDAEYSGMWSSVFVAFPAGSEPDLTGWIAAAAKEPKSPPAVPLDTRSILVQGLMAIDADGAARATPLVVDVRLQTFANRDALAATNATATRDGIDFRVFWLERQALRERGKEAVGLGNFREVAMADQVLFRDYGSLKHTTVAAQCTLCHRRTHQPESALAGFPVLRPTAAARPVRAPDERRRRAEGEFERFLGAARAAAAAAR